VIGVGGGRVAMQIELMQQALKGSRIRGAELLRGISTPKNVPCLVQRANYMP
jgi:hypothetical protein